MAWVFGLAILLYLGCAFLLVAEVFVPSGGLLSVLAFACLAGGLLVLFREQAVWGWCGVGTAVVLIPTTLILSYRIFPKTRFGKAVTLTPPERTTGDAVPDAEERKQLLGQHGEVLTPLRPVGMCDFSGRKVECVAECGYVERGHHVEVIRIQGSQCTVRIHSKKTS